MEISQASATLASLAHPGRLALFRLLVQAGPDGLAAGEIARRTGTLPSTLSASLGLLNKAGLVTTRRDGRSIIHAAHYDAMAALLAFLLEDCCQGRAEVCAPVVKAAQACCN